MVVVVVGIRSHDSVSSVALNPSLHLQRPMSVVEELVHRELGVTFSQSSVEKHLLPSAVRVRRQNNNN